MPYSPRSPPASGAKYGTSAASSFRSVGACTRPRRSSRSRNTWPSVRHSPVGVDAPVDRLGQARVIDERAVLLRERRRRQHVLRDVADRRRQQILHDQQRHLLQRLRLLLADPAARPRRIAGRQVQRLHSPLAGVAHDVVEAESPRPGSARSTSSTPRRFGHFSARMVNLTGWTGLPRRSFG